jgi:hypothetical protein
MGPMRTPARLLGLAFAFVVTFLAGSTAAFADEPVDGYWSGGQERSDLWLLVVFGGGTVGLFVLITLFALLTARRNYVPPPPGNEIQTVADSSPTRHH